MRKIYFYFSENFKFRSYLSYYNCNNRVLGPIWIRILTAPKEYLYWMLNIEMGRKEPNSCKKIWGFISCSSVLWLLQFKWSSNEKNGFQFPPYARFGSFFQKQCIALHIDKIYQFFVLLKVRKSKKLTKRFPKVCPSL